MSWVCYPKEKLLSIHLLTCPAILGPYSALCLWILTLTTKAFENIKLSGEGESEQQGPGAPEEGVVTFTGK